ncbi:MAG: tetratricopeptide repeat protein [bacterium]
MRLLSSVRVAVLVLLGLLAFNSAWAAGEDIKAYVGAQSSFDMQNYKEAATGLETFIRNYPDSGKKPDALFYIGRSYQLMNPADLTKAISSYAAMVATYEQMLAAGTIKATTALDTNRAEAYFHIGECNAKLGQYDLAATAYGNCLAKSKNPDLTVRAQYWLADSRDKGNQTDVALVEYAKVPALSADHALAPWAYYQIGGIQLQNKHFPEAISALEKILDPRYAKSDIRAAGVLSLGFAYAQQGTMETDAAKKDALFAKAIAQYTALQTNANASTEIKQQAGVALGQVYFEKKDYTNAEKAYGSALVGIDQTGETATSLHLARAHALFNLGNRYGDAAAEYKIVAANDKFPTMALEAKYWLGNAYFQQGKPKAADWRKNYQDAIAAFGDYLKAAGDKGDKASQVALYIAYCREDMVVDTDQQSRTDATTAYRAVIDRWPAATEVAEANKGIARLAVKMTLPELRTWNDAKLTGVAGNSLALRLAREEFSLQLKISAAFNDNLADGRKILNAGVDATAINKFHQALDKAGRALDNSLADPASFTAFQKAMLDAGNVLDTKPLVLPVAKTAFEKAIDTAKTALDAVVKDHLTRANTAARLVLDSKPGGEYAAQAGYFIGAIQQLTGDQLLSSGKSDDAVASYSEAIKSYQAALDAQGNGANVDGKLRSLLQRGLVLAYFGAKKTTDSVAVAEAYSRNNFANDDDKMDAQMMLAQAYLTNLQYDKALDAYQQAATDHPKSARVPDALMNVAWIADKQKALATDTEIEKKNKYADIALATYLKIVTDFPQRTDITYNCYDQLAQAYIAKKDFVNAIKALDSIPADSALADKAIYSKAITYILMKDTDKSNAEFKKLRDNYPNSIYVADGQLRMAEFYMNTEMWEKAIPYLQDAANLPNKEKIAALIAFRYGVCAFHLAQYQVAADQFGKAADSVGFEFAVESLLWRAQSYEKMNTADDAAKGREAYLKYVDAAPKGEFMLDALLGAGRCSLLMKKPVDARADLKKTRSECDREIANPDTPKLADRAANVQPEAEFWFAQTYFDEGNYSEALKTFAAVSIYNMQPWLGKSMIMMAKSALARNTPVDLNGARIKLQEVVDRFNPALTDVDKAVVKEAQDLATANNIKLNPPRAATTTPAG